MYTHHVYSAQRSTVLTTTTTIIIVILPFISWKYMIMFLPYIRDLQCVRVCVQYELRLLVFMSKHLYRTKHIKPAHNACGWIFIPFRTYDKLHIIVTLSLSHCDQNDYYAAAAASVVNSCIQYISQLR